MLEKFDSVIFSNALDNIGDMTNIGHDLLLLRSDAMSKTNLMDNFLENGKNMPYV